MKDSLFAAHVRAARGPVYLYQRAEILHVVFYAKNGKFRHHYEVTCTAKNSATLREGLIERLKQLGMDMTLIRTPEQPS